MLYSCSNVKDKVNIKGKFIFSKGEVLYLKDIGIYDKVLIDSVRLAESGEFNFSIPVDDVVFLWLGISENNYITLICSPGEIVELTGDVRSLPATYAVKGTPASESIYRLHTYTLSNYLRMDTLLQIWERRKYDNNKLQLRDSLDSVALSIYDAQKQFVIRFIQDNQESLSSIFGLYQIFGRVSVLDEYEYIDLYEKTAISLKNKYPENRHVNELMARVRKNKLHIKEKEAIIRRLKPGSVVPELSLPDRDGVPVSITEFKGSIVLMYFWSATCPKSRKTNHELVNLHNKHKAQKLLLFNISFNQNTEIWKKAVELDKLPGIHVNDIKSLHSPVLKIFNISNFPHFFLINKEGNIVAHSPSIEKISDSLSELLTTK